MEPIKYLYSVRKSGYPMKPRVYQTAVIKETANKYILSGDEGAGFHASARKTSYRGAVAEGGAGVFQVFFYTTAAGAIEAERTEVLAKIEALQAEIAALDECERANQAEEK